MKLRKILIAFCSVAMILGGLTTSFATENEYLSEYAGQTIAVQVVDETEDGIVSRVVDVAIPAWATEEQARVLIYATAFGWNMVSTYSDDFSVESLGSKQNFTLFSSNEGTVITTHTLQSTLNEIYVTYNIGGLDPSYTTIEAKITNSTAGTSSSWLSAVQTPLPDQRLIKEVIFRTSNIRMNSGDTLTVYGRSHSGTAEIAYCNVTGYYRF